MKKTITPILIPSLVLGLCISLLPVQAEDENPPYTDTSYWNSLCSGTSLTSDQQTACSAYLQYIQGQNSSLQQQISDAQSRKNEASAQLSSVQSQITDLNYQISEINSSIEDLNNQISEAEQQSDLITQQISETKAQIQEKTDDIAALKEKVKKRMAKQQETMRTNQILDVLLGAKSFSEMITIANGLSDISQYDSHTLQQLQDETDQLNQMEADLQNQEAELEQLQADLQSGKSVLAQQQAELVTASSSLYAAQASYQAQLSSAQSDLNSASAALSANQAAQSSVQNGISSSKANNASSSSASDSGSSSQDSSSTSSDAGSSSSSGSSSSGGSSSNQAPSSGDSGGNPYYGGWSNCTWSAWQLVHDATGISLPRWGNAGQWLGNAASGGYSTGSSPRANSLIVWGWHVGYVTAVDGDNVYVKEGNYLGSYREGWLASWRKGSVIGYIYL